MDEITRLFDDARKVVESGMVICSERNLLIILPVLLNRGVL